MAPSTCSTHSTTPVSAFPPLRVELAHDAPLEPSDFPNMDAVSGSWNWMYVVHLLVPTLVTPFDAPLGAVVDAPGSI